MRRPSSGQRRLVILTLALLAFGIAYYGGSRYQNQEESIPPISGVAIRPPSPLPPLTAPKLPGLKPEALSGHWSLLMLDPKGGAIRSPALLRLLQIHNRLAGQPVLQQQIAFLYLPLTLDDAEREAIDSLGDNIQALTGDPILVKETIRRFGLDPNSDTTALYLVGPQTRLHVLFTPQQDIATIVEDLTKLITQEP
jgi:hypothetical protein